MSQNPFTTESANQPSGLLKTLTILSIIGSAFQLIFSVTGYFSAEKNLAQAKKVIAEGQLQKIPDFMKSFYSPDNILIMEKTADNIVPLTSIYLLCGTLCLVGAIWMRKLKRDGFYLWLAGEWLAIIAQFIFIGSIAFQGMTLVAQIFPLAFTIMYVVHVKELR